MVNRVLNHKLKNEKYNFNTTPTFDNNKQLF